MSVWFHQPGLQGEGIITNYVEWNWFVVIRQEAGVRKSHSLLRDGIMKGTVEPSSCISCTSLSTYVDVQEPVPVICEGHEDNAVELLVVEEL